METVILKISNGFAIPLMMVIFALVVNGLFILANHLDIRWKRKHHMRRSLFGKPIKDILEKVRASRHKKPEA